MFKLLNLIRYRFLLFAGLLPYVLGAAIAFHQAGVFDPMLFIIGLIGLFFALVGVETFNEYFDWVLGTDRVFQLNPKPVLKTTFYIGVAAFGAALLVAIYLTFKAGAGVIVFAVLGFVAAAGYLGLPVRFAYRGLGEAVIALAYGPALVTGSYYLQTGRVDSAPLAASIIPAILLFSVAIMNEVPDYLQDHLVGKRNICVRIGRRRTVAIYGLLMLLFFAFWLVMLFMRLLPPVGWLAILLLPLAWQNYSVARVEFESPREFLPAIRGTILLYVASVAVLITSYTIDVPGFLF